MSFTIIHCAKLSSKLYIARFARKIEEKEDQQHRADGAHKAFHGEKRELPFLIDAQLIEAPERKQRGIRLSSQAKNLYRQTDDEEGLPFVGVIAAGRPIEAIEDISYINVPEQIKTGKSCYVLKVKGDSMIEEGIFDGDWVVIEQRSHARNGEIVVALIDKTEATLKFIEQYPHEILLIPANSKMEAMRYKPHQVEIQGVLVGQMRSYTNHN